MSEPSSIPWPAFGGQIGTLIRDADWRSSPLGEPAQWPPALRHALDLLLPSHAQMVLFWGPRFLAFYNDAYAPTIGHKHPRALGRPAQQSWTELWDDLGPLLEGVRTTGQTYAARDRPFQIERHGYLEQVFFDISFSAVREAQGDIGGVLCVVSETTDRLEHERALRRAEEAERGASERIELALNAGAVLGNWVWDITRDHFTSDETFARTFALDAEALARGLPLGEVRQTIHPDDKPAVDALIAEALARGGPYRAQYRVPSPNGSGDGWHWIEANGHVEKNAQGQAVRFPGVLVDIDQRRRAEQARQEEIATRLQLELDLAKTSHHFQLAQAVGGIGVFSLQVASNRIKASAEFYRVFGLTPQDTIQAAKVEALIHPDDRARMSSERTRATGQATLNTEYRVVKADTGEVRWVARRADFIRGADGRPEQMLGVVQDITDRKVAEQALRDSAERFKIMAQAMPNQVWTSHANGQLDWFNELVLSYSGKTAEELHGEGWGDIVHPHELVRVTVEWQHALSTGDPYETEFRIRRHDGQYRWHLVRALPLRDGQVITQWVGTNTDIDDQKSAQMELARLNASLETRVEQRTRDRDRLWRLSTDIMLLARFDGTIEAVNPAWNTLLGWPQEDLLGTSFMDLVHEDDQDATAAEAMRLSDGLTTRSFENRYRHRDGSWRVISWTAVPDDTYIHAVGRDVTAAKAAARALAETEDRLRQSQKMEAVGQLTGGIAHDFNNLLQGITGSLEAVRKRIAQGRVGEIDRFVNGALTSAHRAAALTHRLLAFSRRQPLDPRPVKANPLVASMEDLLRRTLGQHIGLELVLAGGLWPTLCDPNQLESAILNLAINARDAMPDGGQLVIETGNAHLDNAYAARSPAVSPGQYVCIAVTDSGTGMTPDVVERAFDPFFTTKPMGQGTGLGLSMIYGFARQSEGYCRIYSEVGRGTTVKLYLPRYAGDDAEDPPVPGSPPVPEADVGEVVLVVEDEAVVRGLIVEVLAELGYQAIEAADGPSGLEILSRPQQRIDLLVTDIGLPGLNGRQLADAARVTRPDLKVLFMTGYAENAAIANGFLEAGMAMITKPFAMDALALRMRDMIEGKAPSPPSPSVTSRAKPGSP
ncbi:MAG: PAS domain S-box protein [Rubrivivax sp.]|nr:MAG: PAS domain S-box protein [Rubrivivax sp.]